MDPSLSPHDDPRYRLLESLGAWTLHYLPEDAPGYERSFYADCAPILLRHLSGVSVVTATRRTLCRYELRLPPDLEPVDSEKAHWREGRKAVVYRSLCYHALAEILEGGFGISALERSAFHAYAMESRPGVPDPSSPLK